MSADGARLRRWLEDRGWRDDGEDRWAHPGLAPLGKLTADEAAGRQMRIERQHATVRRNEDIRRADRGAEDDWRQAALDTIRRVAQERPELTTDDVLQANPALELGREKRALGPMMLYAARDGLIAPTDRYARSSRRASNARHKRLWLSLVHGGARPEPGRTVGLEILEALQWGWWRGWSAGSAEGRWSGMP